MLIYAIAHGALNLRQRRAGPVLYQLSYISAFWHVFKEKQKEKKIVDGLTLAETVTLRVLQAFS